MINSGEGSGGASRLTRDVTDVVAQVPSVLEALTGLNLGDLASHLPGLGHKTGAEEVVSKLRSAVLEKVEEAPVMLQGPDP